MPVGKLARFPSHSSENSTRNAYTIEYDGYTCSNSQPASTATRTEWSFPDTEATTATPADVGFDVVSTRGADDELGGSFPLILAQRGVE
ncbi:hypothetical protein BRC77_05610 [Halobacteriales archaeon QH_8_64_26]|nr:MAG: hypothetical protein BRC77_05610 [Halobacteriales archaeon QH_8_64_26]